MSTIYERAPAECWEICAKMMSLYHTELEEFGVTIDLLFATMRPDSVKPGAVTLKLHGYQVAAYVKANPYKLRVQGHADAEIVIDGDRWHEWTDNMKLALMDHELEHIGLKKNKDGEQMYDDLSRPKLFTVPHDHQFGWFDSIARRHGAASFEQIQFNDFASLQPHLWSKPADEPEDNSDESDTEQFEADVESLVAEVESQQPAL